MLSRKFFNESSKRAPCPTCGIKRGRHSVKSRRLLSVNCQVFVTFSRHYCEYCNAWFDTIPHWLAAPGKRYTRQAVDLALDLVRRFGITEASLKTEYYLGYSVPTSTLHDWTNEERFKHESANNG